MKQIKSKVSKANWCLVSILVFCLILIPVFLQAKELGEQEVRTAVETWVRHITADARPDAVIERMEPYEVDRETVAYIAHLSGGGFCLSGADDLVLPVYFYSPEGKYNPENPSNRYILWEIGTRLKNLQKGLKDKDPKLQPYQPALSERAAFWQDLSARRIPTRGQGKGVLGEPGMMELNLTTRWRQGWPYNNFCPMGDGGRCVVGCVATAVSQVMKYWNWPPSGTGSRSYTWNGDQSCEGNVGGGTLGATFSDPYDWQNMPDVCWGCTQAQQDALAELCYEVGVALRMDYGRCESGADPSRIDNALEDYFRYDSDVYRTGRDIYKMTREIQWLRAVLLGGHNAQGEGHRWIVFGYNKGTDPNRQFKMNLGWGGSYDFPPYGWYSCDSVPGGLNYGQNHVIQIAPKDVVKFVGDDDPGNGSPDDPYEDIEEALNEAPSGATLVFRAGSDNTFSANTLVINRPFTLKGKNVTIRRQ